MIPALVSLKNLIKTKSYHIDYPLFRLHYQVTAGALLAFCLILTAKILFGDTIDCKGRSSSRDDFYDNMCYSQGTFTTYVIKSEDIITSTGPITGIAANQQNNDQQSAADLPTPQSLGFWERIINTIAQEEVDPLLEYSSKAIDTTSNKTGHHRNFTRAPLLSGTGLGDYLKQQFRVVFRILKSHDSEFQPTNVYIYSGVPIPFGNDQEVFSYTYWHRYYQYIPIILFLQAVFFYLPHYIWKNWENGRLGTVCKQLYDNRMSPSEFIDSNYPLIDYLQNTFRYSKSLVYKYYFCHFLLLLNIIAQILVLNVIFNGHYITYGIDVLYYLLIDNDIYGLRGINGESSDINNPMDFVFPKVTSCTVKTLSQAGKIADESGFLCALPLNILHDKFFLILWFWLLKLAVATVVQIIFDTMYIILPVVRRYTFERRFGRYLTGESRYSTSLTEMFILDLIGSNSDQFAFSSLLKKLNKEEWKSSRSDHSLV